MLPWSLKVYEQAETTQKFKNFLSRVVIFRWPAGGGFSHSLHFFQWKIIDSALTQKLLQFQVDLGNFVDKVTFQEI